MIIIGILLIIGSFGISAYYQSQVSLAGNSINVAGKNRFLTEAIILESEKYSVGRSTKADVNAAISDLGNNIKIIKIGGIQSGLQLDPLPIEYSSYWDNVNQKWNALRLAISVLDKSVTNATLPPSTSNLDTIAKIEAAGADLITASDTLVSQLSLGSARDSQKLVQLGVALLCVNVAIHALFLFLILRMVKPIALLTNAAGLVKKGKFVAVDQGGKGSNSKDEVSVLVSAFNEMVKGLENYDRIGKDFFHMAAHELRNPIQPILGMAEVLQKEESLDPSPRAAERMQLLDAIVRNARKLERLTEEILDVARIEGGTLNLHKDKVDMIRLCMDAVEEYKHSPAKNNDASFLFQNMTKSDRPTYVIGDSLRLTQVIYNLINNALKFTSGGTITVRVNSPDSSRESSGKLQIDVIDQGAGISPEIQDHLFEKFSSTSLSGNGLGLFISKEIVQHHGGRIWAENNKDGKGATFSFTLPVLET